MMKYYKTKNGYVSSIGTVYGAEVTKEEFDAEMDRIQKEQEKEPKPPTLEEQILALQNALITSKISGGGIKVTDSSRMPVEEFAMSGKTEQVQTTGAQLFDISKISAVNVAVDKDVIIVKDYASNTSIIQFN